MLLNAFNWNEILERFYVDSFSKVLFVVKVLQYYWFGIDKVRFAN